MPKAVLPAVLTAAATYVVSGGNWALAVRAFVVTAVVSGVSRALTKKPKNPNPTSQVDAGALTVRQPIAPWQVIVGRVRVGGILTFRYISSDRKYWHMVITFACHRCAALEEVWFNDEKLVIDASSGNVSGRYSKLALTSQLATGNLPLSAQVTVSGSVAGVFSVRLNMGRGGLVEMQDVSPAAPTNWDQYSRSGSTFTFLAVNGTARREYFIQYFSSAPTGGSWARVKTSLGDEGSGVQPFPDLVAESGGAWSNDHKQCGHTKLYIRLEANNDIFPTGIPQVTAVFRGALVYDPRSASTTYSNNAALLAAHYLSESTYGYGLGADYATEIDSDDLIAAANSCDEAVDVADGGTEPRYTVNGSFLTSEQPKAVLERMLAACAGSAVNLGDKWRLNVGVYHAPTVTLSESDLAGGSTVTPMLPSRDDGNVNGIRGVFTNPRSKWQPDDFPAIASDTYAAQDGERRWKDIDLATFVTSFTQAQRLAKIELLRLRQGLTEVATFKIPAWQVVPGRAVARTDTQFGWSAKAFEVLESELEIVEEEGGVTLQTKLTLQETAPEIYDWSTSEEQLEDFAPNTTLPDPGEVAPPGQPTITEELYETRDGRGAAAKAIVTYAQSTYPFRARYQLEYKLTSASGYTVLPAVEVSSGSTSSIVQEILDIQPGRYDFRVATIGASGARSAYAETLDKEIVGLGAAPSAPSIRGLQIAGGLAILTLDPHPDLDVRRGGRWRVRHCEDGVTPAWAESFSIGDAEGYVGDQTILVLPLKPGTYLVKAEDSTGQQSEEFDSIETKQASVLEFSTVATLQEDPTFSGAKADVVVIDPGVLKLEGAGLVDDIPDWDAISSLDDYGGVDAEGTYTFAAGFDFGAVSRRRLTGQIEGLTVNVNDLIDHREDDIDNWLDFDGTAGGGSCDAWIEYRETDDDPSGSPSWSDWKRLDASEVEAWGVQCRLRIVSSDPAYNMHIDRVRVVAAEVL